MKARTTLIACLLTLAAFPSLQAQNLAGDWQGTVAFSPQPLRIVIRISQGDDGALQATAYSLDQGGQPAPVTAIARDGSLLRMAIPALSASYEGRLNSKGNVIDGAFTQGIPAPLVLARATPATAWAIPEPPASARPMAADAPLAFEVSPPSSLPPPTGASRST
jgi:hypothetical protein